MLTKDMATLMPYDGFEFFTIQMLDQSARKGNKRRGLAIRISIHIRRVIDIQFRFPNAELFNQFLKIMIQYRVIPSIDPYHISQILSAELFFKSELHETGNRFLQSGNPFNRLDRFRIFRMYDVFRFHNRSGR